MHSTLRDLFGQSSDRSRFFFAPGRVNLIGEHTDYTGGMVFPCAIDSGTTIEIRKSDDGRFRFASANLPQKLELDPSDLGKQSTAPWCNYPLGAIAQLRQAGLKIPGLEMHFSGNIPNGAGLSSSASVLLATSYAIHQILDTNHSLLDLAKLSQKAEWEYAGTQCGILDQFAVAMGKDEQAMELNCHTLDYRYVPLRLGDLSLVVTNTNQQRSVSDSEYNKRVSECELALKLLRKKMELSHLGDLTPELFNEHAGVLSGESTALRRTRHIVSENQRVRHAVEALEQDNFSQFGILMNHSHASLQQDFEVSSTQLDALVSIAQSLPYVLGSRLTGAGFGGCTISIVKSDSISMFKDEVTRGYKNATGLDPTFYEVKPSAGVRELL